MNIPAGYALAIRSWENDADCYKTQTFYGLTQIDVQFLLSLAKLFHSMNGGEPRGFGGGAWHWDTGEEQWARDIMAAYDKVIADFQTRGVTPQLLESFTVQPPEDFELDEVDEEDRIWYIFDWYSQSIDELVGYAEDEFYRSRHYVRVFDGFKVHKYEAPVTDVTKEFE